MEIPLKKNLRQVKSSTKSILEGIGILSVLFFFVISFLPFAFPVHASRIGISKPGNNLGLVGWWTLDGADTPWTSASAATAIDKSGNGNTGTLTSMNQAVSPVSGKIGQALKFDGSTSYITMGNPASLDIPTNGSVSMCAWVYSYTGSTGTYKGIMAKRSPSTYAYGINFITNLFQVYTSGASDVQTFNYNLPAKIWTHICGVISTTAQTALYTNGSLFGTAGPGGGVLSTTDTFAIGRSGSASNEYFDGLIDDVRIYNRVLSASEIKVIYNSGSAKNVTPNSYRPNLENGLIRHWTFDGTDTPWTSASAATAIDKSGNGNTGTLTSMNQATSPVPGKIGQALNFDPETGYVLLSNSTISMSSGGGMTVTAWVKTTDDFGCIVSLRSLSNDNPVLDLCVGYNGLTGTSGHFVPLTRYDVGVAIVSFTTTQAINNNAWHFVVAVIDQPNNLFYSYVDGTAYTQALATDGAFTFSGGENSIGTEKKWIDTAVQTQDQRFITGSIDDVRVYNRTLSASELSQLYKLGSSKVAATPRGVNGQGLNSGLVGWWTLDGKDMPLGRVLDVSGNGNHGSATNMSTSTMYTQGKIGQALNFDPAGSDYVTISPISAISGATKATLSGWVYRDSTSKSIVFGQYSLLQYRFSVRWQNDSKVYFTAENNGGASFPNFTPSGSQIGWHFVALVYDGSLSGNSRITAYWDGVAQSLTTGGSVPAASLPSGGDQGTFRFGMDSDGNSTDRFDSGKIDDVRVYNRTLSASEILQLYNMGK